MKSSARFALVLSMGLVLGFSAGFGGSVLAGREEAPASSLPLDELRTFSEVFDKIKSDYVEKISDQKLLEYAIRGMLSGLDPHSAYLDQTEFKELQVGTTGEFGGLGIEVGMEDGFVKVVSPIDDTPASRAGVKAGDLVIRINDTPVKGLTLNEAVKMMRGKPGSTIRLTIVREGEQKPLQIAVVRDVIKVHSVKSRMLETGYGYVRISTFQTHTADDVTKALKELQAKSGGHLKGLVLDLRNNPGGVLGAAVGVVDDFVRKGVIVYTEGRASDAKLRFTATPDDLLNGAPMVVLINGGSASASEIVSGALQDHKRAIIMGTRSFGKGSVQTIIPMTNDTAVKLTTARYYTPSGRSIQAEGIEPDVVLEPLKVAKADDNSAVMVKEADLTGHLINDKDKANQAKLDKMAEEEAKGESIASKDYELYEALNVLNGLNILQARAN